jgi:transcriptional regulator with XRE-family HTH domain
MTSPVSIFLRNLRLRAGLTQLDLAHMIGYEQAYVSSIELGTKSPSKEFLSKLTAAMALSDGDRQALEQALKISNRRFTLPSEASTDAFRFCNDLWEKIERLHPSVLTAMQLMLAVEDQITQRPHCQPTRLRRRNSNMEAPM